MKSLGPYLAIALSMQDSYENALRTPKPKLKTPKTKTIRNRRLKNKQAKIARKKGRK